MGLSFPKDKQKTAIIIAILVSILAAAATMLVPVSVLERITGVTGLSEIVPATAAPLGDTARALIAFGTGAITMALMILILVKRGSGRNSERDNGDIERAENRSEKNDDIEDKAEMLKGERLAAIKDRMTNFNLPQMPWKKADNDIRDLADLPNVRAADTHPDAPPRHPLSVSAEMEKDSAAAGKMKDDAAANITEAAEDMPVFEQAVAESNADQKISVPKMSPENPSPEAAVSGESIAAKKSDIVDTPNAAIRSGETAEQPDPSVNTFAGPVRAPEQESLESMIARLEDAMAKRSEQVAAISAKAKAAAKAASSNIPQTPSISKGKAVQAAPAEEASPARVRNADEASDDEQRPQLEAVETDAGDVETTNEADTALNAALETLQRMNAQSR